MDINNLLRVLSEIMFIGRVSSINASDGTVVVARPDRDNKVTAPLHVLNRGSAGTKDYWLPVIDDQVFCIMLPNRNGSGYNEGFVIGSWFNAVDTAPAGGGEDTRVLDIPSNMTINVGGTLSINASRGDVVVNGISLVHHEHGGVQAGGSKTAQPE